MGLTTLGLRPKLLTGVKRDIFALLVQANAAGQRLLVRVRVIVFCVAVGPANLAKFQV